MISPLTEIASPLPASAIGAGYGPEEIKRSLPVTLKEIARRAKTVPSTVTRVIKRERRHAATESALARSLKVSREELGFGNAARKAAKGKR